MTDATTPTPEARQAAEALVTDWIRAWGVSFAPTMEHVPEALNGLRVALLAFGAAQAAAGRAAARAAMAQADAVLIEINPGNYTDDDVAEQNASVIAASRILRAALRPTPAGPCPQCGGAGRITVPEHAMSCQGDCRTCPVPADAPCDHPSHRTPSGAAPATGVTEAEALFDALAEVMEPDGRLFRDKAVPVLRVWLAFGQAREDVREIAERETAGEAGPHRAARRGGAGA